MIYIDYFGGLHGHFLEYSINALDDSVKQFDPFSEFGTSHKPFPKLIAKANHFSSYNIPVSGHIISIVADEKDCLIVNLLNLGRGGDCNFDLDKFELNLGTALRNTPYYQGFRDSLLHYGIDLDQTDSVPRGVLRESIKYNFADPKTNSLMQHVYHMKHLKAGLNIHFRSFYGIDTYIETLEQIVREFDLPYTIDKVWYSQLLLRFREKVIQIDQEQDSLDVLQCVIDRKNRPIKFNIVQEAYLNAELEKLYGIEMPFDQEQYFVDTNDINKHLKRL